MPPCGLHMGAFMVVSPGDKKSLTTAQAKLGFPLVVKPSSEGSSVGVSVVNTSDELAPAVKLAHSYDREVLIERYIRGMEVQVGILGDRALGAIEIVPKDIFY